MGEKAPLLPKAISLRSELHPCFLTSFSISIDPVLTSHRTRVQPVSQEHAKKVKPYHDDKESQARISGNPPLVKQKVSTFRDHASPLGGWRFGPQP